MGKGGLLRLKRGRKGSDESARWANGSLQKGIRFAGDCFAQVEFAKV